MNEVREHCRSELPRIIYEFDASGCQNGYPLAAQAAAFRGNRVQMAAYFTYTPAAVAQWNPGWLVHYLAMEHTPAKAAGFAAAAAIFHCDSEPETVIADEHWEGKNFTIDRNGDLVIYADEKEFYYSNDNEKELPSPETLEKIFGRGSSVAASCSGNGCYVLEKCAEKEWLLHLHPAQKFLCDPQRGRQYRHMANRWVSCTKEPPVSQISDRAVEFAFKLAPVESITAVNGEVCCNVTAGNKWMLHPGDYRIRLK